MSITEEMLNDLRRRVLDHEAAVAEGKADPASPPYTIEEFRDALAAISQNRASIPAPAPRKAKASSVDISLEDLL